MPHKFYVEEKANGKRQFVLKRSNSEAHHHHHHHRHHRDEEICTSRDEMDNMKERERNLRYEIERLKTENRTLSANFQFANHEQRRLQGYALQLEDNLRRLGAENQQLRRSMDSNHSNASERVREHRMKYTKVKNENEGLRQTIHHLEERIHDAVDDRIHRLQQEVKKWMKRFEDTEILYREERARLHDANQEVAQCVADNESLQRELDRTHRELAEKNRILRRFGLLR